MGEFELIRHYFAAAACARAGGDVALGIGDDCALLTVPVGDADVSVLLLEASFHRHAGRWRAFLRSVRSLSAWSACVGCIDQRSRRDGRDAHWFHAGADDSFR